MIKKIAAISLVITLLAMVGLLLAGFFISKPTDTSVTQNQSSTTDTINTSTTLMCGVKGGACTTEEIATHNKASDCWVIYDGSYYDVTDFVGQHEGGSGAFTASTCGADITRYLNGSTNSGTTVKKNNHSSSAYNILNTYKIGPVR